MKIMITLAIGLGLAAAMPSSAKDDNGHTLVKLWKEWDKAVKADLPKDELIILGQIKEEARKQKLAWDFYEACDTYMRTATRMDWKLRDSLSAVKEKELKGFSEPVAWFYACTGSNYDVCREFIEKNGSRLQAARNPEFYTRDWRITGQFYGDALPELLESDYDYALWCAWTPAALKDKYKDYPLNAFAEYRQIAGMTLKEERTPATEAFISKYKGKAVAMVAEGSLLSDRWTALLNDRNSTSGQYKALADDCRDFEKRRASFSGNEAKILKRQNIAATLLENMEAKGITLDVKDGKLLLGLQNLESVSVNVTSGTKSVFEKYITNPRKSFFVRDELMVDLPDFPDGTYKIRCSSGKTEAEQNYDKYTVSAAAKNIAGRISVWAADYISGRPLDSITVEVVDDGKVLESASLKQSGGFADLPESMCRLLGGSRSNRIRIRDAANPERSSRTFREYDYYPQDLADKAEKMNGILLTDRSAFNPDETLHFKAILYRGYYDYKVAAGVKAEVSLIDAEDKVIETLQDKTNGFGSFDGSFVLRRGNRNGHYSLQLKFGGEVICTESVLVDDFVLPTFDLIFDRKSDFERPVETVEIGGSLKAYSGHSLKNAKITYTVRKPYGPEVFPEADLDLDSDGRFSIRFKPQQSVAGAYESYRVTVKVTDVTGETMEFQKHVSVYDAPKPTYRTEYYFDEMLNSDGKLELKVVAGEKDTWLLTEVYGIGDRLLSSNVQKFSPASGKAGTIVKYALRPDDKDAAVQVKVLYFQDKNLYSHSSIVRRTNHRCDLDLEFSRFLDTTAPRAQYSFTIKTAAGTECAATIFDKSTERFAGNYWWKRDVHELPAPSVLYATVTGVNESHYIFSNKMMIRGALAKSSAGMAMMAEPAEAAVEMEESSASYSDDLADGAGNSPTDVEIREDFATTIAWEPFLRSDDNGKITFTFTNADKLSTYYVQLYAHDKDMRNQALRREMKVTLPVKISLAEPRFLYEGDRYAARIGLSSSMSRDLSGTLSVSFLDGADHKASSVLGTVEKKLTVPAGGALSIDAETSAPGISTLGIKAVFRPDEGSLGSDGIFVAVPVRKAVQTIGESHSGVLLAGGDRASLEKELRSLFVNIPGSEAGLREISILDMVKEALPTQIGYSSSNAISIARALYAHHLCSGLGQETEFDKAEAIEKLMACKGAEGGFAWFEGMSPSPLITAVVLNYLHGLGIVDEEAAVRFIDDKFFNRDEKRWWYCGLSLEQYLATRSLFPEVPLEQKVSKDIRNNVKAYLVPKKARGLNGMIFSKARRLLTLENLLSSKEGIKLSRQLGVRFCSGKKLRKSLAADVASLVQYARPHKNGGCYYPNAVMPWRGLLESELDAHSCLCSIMDRHGYKDISDGIRIWIMLQKETQHWDNDPGYVEAIGKVLEGSDEVLATKVLALSGEFTKPFKDIKAAGNGMKIAPSGTLPDTLKVGSRIRLSYSISNDENRSFVKLTIPYNAGLVPVNQVSGYRYGCYRNVLQDRIECWYEVYPEEETVVSEEFYVTRAGTFQCPAATIKCEYAPHYEANTAAPAVQTIE